MQLKLKIEDEPGSHGTNSSAEYRVFVTCNKCGGIHDMGISLAMKDGPAGQQSIGDLYQGKTLPKSLADLTSRSITCPKTGKQSVQKNSQQIFLARSQS
jgi:hypothetical protein